MVFLLGQKCLFIIFTDYKRRQMNLIKYVKQPFPKAESKWITIISISLFVPLFLIIFQPLGISQFEYNHKILFLSGFGLVTFIVLIINLIVFERIFTKFFNEKHWTIWKEFLWLIWVIFCIGLGNALYTLLLLNNSEPNLSVIINFQIATLIIATIPISILIISKQKYLLNKYLISAEEVNKSLHQEKTGSIKNQIISFYSDNQKDFIEFEISDFLYIESSKNYVEIYLWNENKVTQKTFRSTLKRAIDFFSDTPEVIQCHRAFIVNTSKINNVKGNSQGLRLDLENCDIEVPVSRGYVETIKNKI